MDGTIFNDKMKAYLKQKLSKLEQQVIVTREAIEMLEEAEMEVALEGALTKKATPATTKLDEESASRVASHERQLIFTPVDELLGANWKDAKEATKAPDITLGDVRYWGNYDGIADRITGELCSLNGMPLPASTERIRGHYFVCQTAFELGGVKYSIGDWLISRGIDGWSRIDNGDDPSPYIRNLVTCKVLTVREFFANLKARRVERKLTADEVADAVKVDKSYIYMFEKGTPIGKKPIIVSLAKFFGIELTDVDRVYNDKDKYIGHKMPSAPVDGDRITAGTLRKVPDGKGGFKRVFDRSSESIEKALLKTGTNGSTIKKKYADREQTTEAAPDD